jgi:hypothetical protein
MSATVHRNFECFACLCVAFNYTSDSSPFVSCVPSAIILRKSSPNFVKTEFLFFKKGIFKSRFYNNSVIIYKY